MFGSPFRLEPAGQPSDYRTFGISIPKTAVIPASCEQVDCPAWAAGWVTRVPAGSDLEAAVRSSGRRWASAVPDGGELVFTFPPGTSCFRAATHRRNAGHPGVFTVRDGDHRSFGGPARVHQRPEDWAENLQEHTEHIRQARERG